MLLALARRPAENLAPLDKLRKLWYHVQLERLWSIPRVFRELANCQIRLEIADYA